MPVFVQSCIAMALILCDYIQGVKEVTTHLSLVILRGGAVRSNFCNTLYFQEIVRFSSRAVYLFLLCEY